MEAPFSAELNRVRAMDGRTGLLAKSFTAAREDRVGSPLFPLQRRGRVEKDMPCTEMSRSRHLSTFNGYIQAAEVHAVLAARRSFSFLWQSGSAWNSP